MLVQIMQSTWKFIFLNPQICGTHPTGIVSCSKYDHKNKFCLHISCRKQGQNVCVQFWKFPESIFTATMKLGQSNIFSSVCQ